MITFEHIKVAFGDFVAVPDFSLHIGEGEFFTLLGPSGCGKTTVLRALAGLNQPAAGKILIEGKDVTKLPSDKRKIGMVFQNYALFPSMNVESNIGYGLRVAKVPKAEIAERVRAIAKEVELGDKELRRGIAELSGGQQQRVAIARALVSRPRILLLDEPLSNLDAKLRAGLRIQLKEMQEHFGITSLYVTHDQEEALTMSDRLAVLREGEIEQVGTPRQIYSDSNTEFVCKFIGEANRIPSSLLSHMGANIPHADEASYVRIERITLTAPGIPVPAGYLSAVGTIIGTRYQGAVCVYMVQAPDGTTIRALEKDDGSRDFLVGEKIQFYFPQSVVLSYRRGQRI